MRACSLALSDYLANNDNVVIVDLYTFALASGEVLRYAGWNTPLRLLGSTFPAQSLDSNPGGYTDFALGPRFGRSKVTTKIGIEPAELDIEVIAGPDDLVGTFPFAEVVRLGLFDGASVELDRLFAPPAPLPSGLLDTSLGPIVWFYGRIADSDVGRARTMLKVKSLMNLLAIQQMPRRLYQASCGHVFGDRMCGYDRTAGKNAAGAITGNGAATVTAVAGTTQATITATAAVPSIYQQGTVTGLAGANANYTRTIKNLGNGSQLALLKPFLFPLVHGDTFTVLPGCDHTTSACQNLFDNLARYGGFPYIQPPELAV